MNVMRAVTVGDVETVNRWFNGEGKTHPVHARQVLMQAARHGQDNICELALNSGHVSDDDIADALSAACCFDHLSTAQFFVRHCNFNTQHLTQALSDACLNGEMRIVTWLISDVMTLSHTDRITWLLTAACAHGDMSDIQQLATQVDSDVTRVMSQVLIVACHMGRDDVVEWLTSHTTADASSRGVMYEKIYGETTSLMVACRKGKFGNVRRLLQCVTPHTVNMMSGNMRHTALHFTISSEFNINLLLREACINGNIDTVVDLSNKLDINVHEDNGYTGLHFACALGHMEIVRILLSNFARTDVTNDTRHTPAMLAEELGHTKVLPYLQCPMSVTPDNLVHVPDNSNTVSVSELPVEHATNSNT